jgi:hypothetical protein
MNAVRYIAKTYFAALRDPLTLFSVPLYLHTHTHRVNGCLLSNLRETLCVSGRFKREKNIQFDFVGSLSFFIFIFGKCCRRTYIMGVFTDR